MGEIILTIYTPTYNRSKLILRVYKSLQEQTLKKFKWLIIDDGSTDDTKTVVEGLIEKEKSFQIEYYYKVNGGVHTARDVAYNTCSTELLMGIDSDDWLLPDAVENIYKIWKKNNRSDVVGIFATCLDKNGKRLGEEFPKDLQYATYQELMYKYKLRCDAAHVLKAEVMKKLDDAPSFEGEKLIGEDFKMIQIPNNLYYIIEDIPMQIKDYQHGGYSAEAYLGIFKNPYGFREDYRQHIIHAKYLYPKIRGELGYIYIVCSFIIKDVAYLKNAPNKINTILLTPLGWLGYVYLVKRAKRRTDLENLK